MRYPGQTLFFCLAALVVTAALATSTTIDGSRDILGAWDACGATMSCICPTGTSPYNCTKIGQCFIDTDAPSGQRLYVCEATGTPGTWVLQGDGGGAGGGNSFTTIDAPTGTDPVADSTADTLTLTATSPLSVTGDGTADSLAFAIQDATADGTTKGAATFVAADFDSDGSGRISIDSATWATRAAVPSLETDAAHDNCSEITGCVPNAITAGQVPANETDAAHDTCSEISGCVVGAYVASNADADGTTKGIATFDPTDFDADGSGRITIGAGATLPTPTTTGYVTGALHGGFKWPTTTPTVSQMSIQAQSNVLNGVADNVLVFAGYNLGDDTSGKFLAGEHSQKFQIEGTYWDGSRELAELNYDYVNTAGDVTLRPFAIYIQTTGGAPHQDKAQVVFSTSSSANTLVLQDTNTIDMGESIGDSGVVASAKNTMVSGTQAKTGMKGWVDMTLDGTDASSFEYMGSEGKVTVSSFTQNTTAGGAVGTRGSVLFQGGSTGTRTVPNYSIGVDGLCKVNSTGTPAVTTKCWGMRAQATSPASGSSITVGEQFGVYVKAPDAKGANVTINNGAGIVIDDMKGQGNNNQGSLLIYPQTVDTNGNKNNLVMMGGGYSDGHINLDTGHLWYDKTNNRFRMKEGAPTTETAGSPVGDMLQATYDSGADGTVDSAAIVDAVADGTTKGKATFLAADFDSDGSGRIGLQDCAANQILKRNGGDTAWACAADEVGAGGSPSGTANAIAQFDSDGTGLVEATGVAPSLLPGSGRTFGGYNASAVGTFVAMGIPAATVAGTLTAQLTSARLLVRAQTTSQNNNAAGILGPYTVTTRNSNPYLKTNILPSGVVTNLRIWVGLSSASLAAVAVAASGSSTAHFTAIGYEAGVNSGRWMCCSGNGSAYACTDMGGSAVTSTNYTISLDYRVDATVTCKAGALSTDRTTNLPSGNVALGVHETITNTSAVTHIIDLSHIFLEQAF